MCHEKNRFVSKSFKDQFFKYIRADICVNRTQRIIEKVNVPEMINKIVIFDSVIELHLSKTKKTKIWRTD